MLRWCYRRADKIIVLSEDMRDQLVSWGTLDAEKIEITTLGDAYEGRASGTPGHERAAVLVAHKLAEAGFKPLGTDGSWYQRVPLEELAVSFATLRADGGTLSHLDDFVVRPQPGVPSDKAYSLVYRGYCAAQDLGEARVHDVGVGVTPDPRLGRGRRIALH